MTDPHLRRRTRSWRKQEGLIAPVALTAVRESWIRGKPTFVDNHQELFQLSGTGASGTPRSRSADRERPANWRSATGRLSTCFHTPAPMSTRVVATRSGGRAGSRCADSRRARAPYRGRANAPPLSPLQWTSRYSSSASTRAWNTPTRTRNPEYGYDASEIAGLSVDDFVVASARLARREHSRGSGKTRLCGRESTSTAKGRH